MARLDASVSNGKISPALTGVYVGYIRHYHSAQSRSDKLGAAFSGRPGDIVIMVRIRCSRTACDLYVDTNHWAKNVITTITTDNHLWSNLLTQQAYNSRIHGFGHEFQQFCNTTMHLW